MDVSNENKIDLKWNIDTGYVTKIPDRILWIDPKDFIGYSDVELEEALYCAAYDEMSMVVDVYVPNISEVKQMIADYRDRNEDK